MLRLLKSRLFKIERSTNIRQKHIKFSRSESLILFNPEWEIAQTFLGKITDMSRNFLGNIHRHVLELSDFFLDISKLFLRHVQDMPSKWLGNVLETSRNVLACSRKLLKKFLDVSTNFLELSWNCRRKYVEIDWKFVGNKPYSIP